jgi:hypothetical protein
VVLLAQPLEKNYSQNLLLIKIFSRALLGGLSVGCLVKARNGVTLVEVRLVSFVKNQIHRLSDLSVFKHRIIDFNAISRSELKN